MTNYEDDDALSVTSSHNRRFDLDTAAAMTLPDTDTVDDQPPLPAHACHYCAISNPTAVCKCLGCNRWFCNGRNGGSGAHIVQHLVRSKHKELAMHADSLVGECTLECYACGNKNLFALGWVSGKEDPSLVVILCRVVCPQAAAKTGEWDPNTWKPLIEERAMTSLLVNTPNEVDLQAAKPITASDMTRLEEVWKKCPTARVEDLPFLERQESVELPVQLHYKDVYEFNAVYEPLVQLEADYDRSLKESQCLSNVVVRWDSGINQRRIAWIPLSSSTFGSSSAFLADPDFRITPGDEVELIHEEAGLKAIGNIIEVPSGSVSEEIAVEIQLIMTLTGDRQGGSITTGKTIFSYSTHFTLRFVWKSIPFDRMRVALRRFATDPQSVSPVVQKIILGHETRVSDEFKTPSPSAIKCPGLPPLNPSQEHAVKSVLNKPLALIQGPPGTGKTVTSAAIVYTIASVMQRGPVLVVAPSNVAVDHLTEKIHLTGLRTVRIAAKCRESMQSGVDYLSLHEQLRNSDAFPELGKLFELKRQVGRLSDKDETRLIIARNKAESKLLDAAQVVTCTCSGAGDKRLQGRRFATVLIDEATQACEPECLVPIVRGAKQVILVGDHRQLGPVILNKRAAKAGFSQSLFERLIKLGVTPVMLQIQYRMHPCLSEFPSNTFYQGALENGVTGLERGRRSLDFPWHNPESPMMFINCTTIEELSGSGTSYLNRGEAILCEKIVTRLLRSSSNATTSDNQTPPILPSSIGVITPYEGQRAYLQHTMQTNGPLSKDLYMAVEVASVDAFQGREKDYIVLSCVRSNEHGGIGFLTDPRRLNVALTRAKYGLIILGNARLLSKFPLWHHLVSHYKSKGLLLEGSVLNALRPSVMPLGRPPRLPASLFEDHSALMSSLSRSLSIEDTESVEYLRTLPEMVNRDTIYSNVPQRRHAQDEYDDEDENASTTTTLETQP